MSALETLQNRFSFLKDNIRQQNEKRLWAEVAYANFFPVFDLAVKELGFTHLCTITGLDEGEYLAFIYHLASKDGVVFSLKTKVLKDKEALKTITGYFPGGAIYERELVDLFGARVEGLPGGPHYPLPDGWPAGQYPLRKDWDQKILDKLGGNYGL